MVKCYSAGSPFFKQLPHHLVSDGDRKKIVIEVSPEDLNVSFGDQQQQQRVYYVPERSAPSSSSKGKALATEDDEEMWKTCKQVMAAEAETSAAAAQRPRTATPQPAERSRPETPMPASATAVPAEVPPRVEVAEAGTSEMPRVVTPVPKPRVETPVVVEKPRPETPVVVDRPRPATPVVVADRPRSETPLVIGKPSPVAVGRQTPPVGPGRPTPETPPSRSTPRAPLIATAPPQDAVAVTVEKTRRKRRKPPVSVQITPTSIKGPLTRNGLQVECPHEGGTIRVSSPRSRSPEPTVASPGGRYHVQNDPNQSVTLRAMKDMNVRTQQLRDGVQFRLDGRPGVQLSIKLGEPRLDSMGIKRNCFKIEAQPVPMAGPPPVDGSSSSRRSLSPGRWQQETAAKFRSGSFQRRSTRRSTSPSNILKTYQRPTVSYLIHSRMTELYKELTKTLTKSVN